MKTKISFHIKVFQVVACDGDIILLFIFQLSVWLPGSRGWLLKGPMAGDRILCHATQTREPRVGFEEISATTSYRTYCRLTQNAISLIIVFGTRLSKRQRKR